MKEIHVYATSIDVEVCIRLNKAIEKYFRFFRIHDKENSMLWRKTLYYEAYS